MAKVKAFELTGYVLEMYTAENVNEPPHFNLKDRQRGLDIKIWINSSTQRSVDYIIVRPRSMRTGRSAIDGRTERILAQLIDNHRDDLLQQWREQIEPQQQNDLKRSDGNDS